VLDAVLPTPRHEPAVFSDGQSVFVAGGLDDQTVLTQIVRFNPSTNAVDVLPEVLPTATYAAGVAWTDTAAYLFGGLGKNGALSQIVRYSPSEASATIMKAQLPKAAYNVVAVWADSVIYVVGGYVAAVHLTQILRYDPSSDTLTTMTATLPVGVEEPAVFWDGSLVWVLGGKADAAGTTGTASNAVQVLDPSSGEAKLAGTLPYGVWGVPAFTDGDLFYLPGGSSSDSTGYTSIFSYDPVAQSASTFDFSLPVHIGGRSGAWVSSQWAGYICGGADTQTGKKSDKIIQVVPQ
jgi:N-acetylneuraminic acid mutarotase